MLIKTLLLVFALLFICCNGMTLELMKSLSPESEFSSKAVKELSNEQMRDFDLFSMKHLDKIISPSEHEEKKLMEELKTAHPDIYEKFDAAEKEYRQKLAEMSQTAQDFFEFYNNYKRGIFNKLRNLDEPIAAIICGTAPKWNALNRETKYEIDEKFPDLHRTLNDQQLQQKACKLAPPTVSTFEFKLRFNLPQNSMTKNSFNFYVLLIAFTLGVLFKL